MKKIQNVFANGILIMLGCFVAYSMYQAFFILPGGNLWKGNNADFTALCMAGVVLFIALLWMFYQIIRKREEKQAAFLKYGILFLIVVLQIVWLYVVLTNHVYPATDLATDTNEAIKMLETGKFAQNSSAAIYPINRTHIIILFAYYKLISLFGFECYWQASVILALVCMDAAVLISCKIVRVIAGIKGECLFALLCGLNPVVYLCLPYYYTSVLSLPFMMASAYFILRMMKEGNARKGIIYSMAAGVLSALGYSIRGTALFPLIAFVVYMICKLKKDGSLKCILIRTLTAIGMLFIVLFIWGRIIHHFDPYDRSATALPMTHTLMMGLQGQGGFLQSDVDYSLSFTVNEERIDANIKVIKQRLEDMGIPGYLNLVGEKIKYNWSEGHARFSNWYPASFRYITGVRRDVLMLYSQILRIVMWMFMLVNIYFCLKTQKRGFSFILLVVQFGAFFLHVFIEANPQYSIPFLLVMSIVCVEGIMIVADSVEREWGRDRKEKSRLTFFLATSISCMVLVINMVEWCPSFTEYKRDVTKVVSAQNYKSGGISTIVADHLVVKQTFVASDKFNTLRLRGEIKNSDIQEEQYQFLLSDEEGAILVQKDFGIEQMDSSGKYITFSFDEILPEKETEYAITIMPIEGKESAGDSLNFAIEASCLDYAVDGELWVNDEEYENGDLTYIACLSLRSPIWGTRSYWLMCIAIISVGIAITAYYFWRWKSQRHRESL